jgi:hypothetical protein
MPSATISGNKTSDIGNPHDGKSIRSKHMRAIAAVESGAARCDNYATTARNTPVQVDDRHCGHDCRAPTTDESGEPNQWGCVVNVVEKRREYWASSALPLRSYGAARLRRRPESISAPVGSLRAELVTAPRWRVCKFAQLVESTGRAKRAQTLGVYEHAVSKGKQAGTGERCSSARPDNRNEPKLCAYSIKLVLHCHPFSPTRVLGKINLYCGELNMRCSSMLVRVPSSSL